MPSASVVLKALSGISWSEMMHVKALSKSQRGAVVLLMAGRPGSFRRSPVFVKVVLSSLSGYCGNWIRSVYPLQQYT